MGGGGAPKGSRAQPAYAVFPPQQLKNGNHLAEVVRSKPGRRIYGENATYPPILAFLGLFAYPTPRGSGSGGHEDRVPVARGLTGDRGRAPRGSDVRDASDSRGEAGGGATGAGLARPLRGCGREGPRPGPGPCGAAVGLPAFGRGVGLGLQFGRMDWDGAVGGSNTRAFRFCCLSRRGLRLEARLRLRYDGLRELLLTLLGLAAEPGPELRAVVGLWGSDMDKAGVYLPTRARMGENRGSASAARGLASAREWNSASGVSAWKLGTDRSGKCRLSIRLTATSTGSSSSSRSHHSPASRPAPLLVRATLDASTVSTVSHARARAYS